MEAAHIIPFSLNNFNTKFVRCALLFLDVLLNMLVQRDAAHTWDILQSWTQIDIKKVVGSNINSPTNALYMTTSEHRTFGHFRFYLDKDAVSRFHDDSLLLMLMHLSTRMFLTSTGCAWLEMATH